MDRSEDKLKIGLSLAGGGLKSFSQVAVLQDLERHQIDVDAVAGTSMGAVVAAMIACGLTGEEIEMKLLETEKEFDEKGIFRKPAAKILQQVKERMSGFIEMEILENMACQLFESFGCKMISECLIPIAITSVDIHTGELIIFTNDPELFRSSTNEWLIYPKDIDLGKAVAASCAFPLVFSTAVVDERQLVDGGVMMNLPIPLFDRNFFDVILSVSMVNDMSDKLTMTPLNIAFQSLGILIREMDRQLTKQADIQVNFPIEPNLIFKVGSGKSIIRDAKEMLKEHPIDYHIFLDIQAKKDNA